MPARHSLLAASVALLWGVNFVAIDVGLETFPPLLFVALRFALTAFPAILFVAWPRVATGHIRTLRPTDARSGARPLGRDPQSDTSGDGARDHGLSPRPHPRVAKRWVFAVGLFLSVGQFGLLFVGIHAGMPAGLASLVIQLQAIFTILLAVAFLGERPTARQLLGATVAFAGLALIAAGRTASVSLLALLLVVGAGASWGLSNVCTRLARPQDAFSLLVWASAVGPIPLTALSLSLEGPRAMNDALASVGWAALLSLLYVVVVSTLFGFGAWTWLLARHPASRVAPFSLLAPVAALVSTWLARGEKPGAIELAGGGVILAGLALAVLPRRLRSASDLSRSTPSAPPSTGRGPRRRLRDRLPTA
jgi:O-acetylserine/cysteine efflux transporter